MEKIKDLAKPLAEIGASIAAWLNPQRRMIETYKGAIESAEQLMDIYTKQGRYKDMSDKELKEFEVHYLKRFDSWKDGKG